MAESMPRLRRIDTTISHRDGSHERITMVRADDLDAFLEWMEVDFGAGAHPVFRYDDGHRHPNLAPRNPVDAAETIQILRDTIKGQL